MQEKIRKIDFLNLLILGFSLWVAPYFFIMPQSLFVFLKTSGILISFVFLGYFFLKEKTLLNSKQFLIFILYFFICIFYFLRSFDMISFKHVQESLFLLEINAFLGFVFSSLVFRKKKYLYILFFMFYGLSVLCGILNLLQFFMSGFKINFFIGRGNQSYQMISLAFCLFSIPHMVYIFWGRLFSLRILSFVMFFIFLFFILNVGGVAGGVSFVVLSFFTLLLNLKNKNGLLILFLIFLIFLIFSFYVYQKSDDFYFVLRLLGKTKSIKLGRDQMFLISLGSFLDFKNIFWGIGSAKTSILYGAGPLRGFYPHNVFVEILSELGIFAFFALFFILVLSLKNIKDKIFQNDFLCVFIVLFLFYLLLSILAIGSFEMPFFHIFLGIICAIQGNDFFAKKDSIQNGPPGI